jgi:HEAT repeat protein
MQSQSQYSASDDGNFRRRGGAGMAIGIGIGAVIAIGLGIGGWMMLKGGSGKPTDENVQKMEADIALLSQKEQLPRWRELAKPGNDPRLQQEAFAHLAWVQDPEGLQLIIQGLSSPDKSVVGTAAAAIYEYGSPAADAAKPALLKALQSADDSNKGQICYALVILRETSAFDTILAAYKQGLLGSLQRLDGRPAFDPLQMAHMIAPDRLAQLAGDNDENVRVLVAKVLSENGDPKWLDVLTRLVGDKSMNVAREAAVGLGKIASAESMGPLLAALEKSSDQDRRTFLDALRDGVGGKGLVLALKSVNKTDAFKTRTQTQQIFDMLKDLADPRAADALVDYLTQNPPPAPHFRTEAALRLAEIGDVRAAPHLAWRLTQSPHKIYNLVDDGPALYNKDDERIVSARMLADLSVMHPDKRDQLRRDAESSVFTWFDDLLLPSGNGLRFLADVHSPTGLTKLKAWADPSTALPANNAPNKNPDPEFIIAPSALRYLGKYKEPSTWSIFEKQINRRKPDFNASMDALMAGNMGTMLALVISGLGKGAAEGFAEWGDSKAFDILVAKIEEPKEADQTRAASCAALPFVASDDQMKIVVKKVHDNAKNDGNAMYLQACYLEALVRRPVADANAGLMDMLQTTADPEVRHKIARAIGMGGLTNNEIPIMMDKLKDPQTRDDAALALLLGADADTVMRAFAMFNATEVDAGTATGSMEELKSMYNDSFEYWSDRSYDAGDLARWVENAQALEHVKVNDVFQDWPTMILSRNIIEGLTTDNGPHSITRVVLRAKLLADARGTNDIKRNNAIRILKFMKERGALMTLKSENGPGADQARQALFDILNPKLTTEHVPEAPKTQDLKPPSAANVNVNVVPR